MTRRFWGVVSQGNCNGIITFSVNYGFWFNRLRTQLINRPIFIFSSYGGISPWILLRCGQLFTVSGLGIWSCLDGMLCLAYVFGNSIWMRLSKCSTTKPLTLCTISLSRPSNVLKSKLISTPSIPSSRCTWVVMKVVLLASSKSA